MLQVIPRAKRLQLGGSWGLGRRLGAMAQIPHWGCHPWLLRGLWSSATCDMNKSNGEKQADEEMNKLISITNDDKED